MQLELKGKVAVVTGASRGIGRSIAGALAGEGCDLLVTARNHDALQALRELYPEVRIEACAADLREPEAADRIVAAAAKAFGRIDILVNNAGATKRGDFFALSEIDWQDGFALKFFGHVRLIRAAWPLLHDSKGAVINIVGAGGRTPGAEFAIGGSVNAALLSLTKAMAEIGIRDGVTVNAINPGPIETERLQSRIDATAEAEGLPPAEARERVRTSLGVSRFGKPEEIAALVAFLASGRSRYIHGALIDVDGGQTKTI